MTLIGVDVGGTFTDVVAIDGSEITTVKVPTTYPDTERGVLEGASRAFVDTATVFNHASTHGLNAIITRRLPKIAFLVTDGHRDILDQGRGWRPPEALTDPHWRRSFGDAARPVVPRYLRRGIVERLLADGTPLLELDEDQARQQLAVLRKCGVQGVAICLLHAYANPVHEQRLAELVREELGNDLPVSLSSEVSPLAKEFARASTTVVDVVMRLIYGDYTRRLHDGLRELGFSGQLNYANCAAQLVSADMAIRRPFEVIFAGPAAGTVAGVHFGGLIGATDLLCADVGGTSSDLSLIRGGKPLLETTFEIEHDFLVNALSNQVTSIGAGGGSLVAVNAAGEIEVGPASAGADPGPASYGRGGTAPTLTDTCLLMGIIDPDSFAGGGMRLDIGLAEAAFGKLDTLLSHDERVRYAFQIGVHNIAEGINNLVVQHGIDVRDFSLVAFGAAGPMLLPASLGLVKAAEVIVPPHPGLFSALGLVSSEQVYADSRSAYTVLETERADAVEAIYREMEAGLREKLGVAGDQATFVRSFDGRLLGQTWETPFVRVPQGSLGANGIDAMVENFHTEYAERWGNRFDAIPVQGVTYRVEAILPAEKVRYAPVDRRAGADGPVPVDRTEVRYLEQQPVPCGVYDRLALRDGDIITGAGIIREPLSTTFILPGQRARVGRYGELHITQDDQEAARAAH